MRTKLCIEQRRWGVIRLLLLRRRPFRRYKLAPEIEQLKKTALIGFIFSSLAGCTFTSVDKVGPGEYMLTNSGSVFNSREGMLEDINQKAKKLCNGKPYRLEGNSDTLTLVSMPTQIGPTPTTFLALKAICSDDSLSR